MNNFDKGSAKVAEESEIRRFNAEFTCATII